MNTHEEGISPQGWLLHAKSNLALAQAGQYIADVYLEDLCLEAQQAARRALKALCIHLNLDFPKTNSLSSQGDILKAGSALLPDDLYRATILTQYVVLTCYPAMVEPITRNEYEAALELAERVIKWVEKTLGQVKK